MRTSALLVFLTLVAAGCTSLPGGSVDTPAAAAPTLSAPDAALRVIGDTVFATWTGTLRPLERLPAPNPILGPPADPTKPDERTAVHPFTMPAGITQLRGWLNASTQSATMTLQVLNDTNRRVCGERFHDDLPAECFATFYRPLAQPAEWTVRATLDRLEGEPADVPYELTLAFNARELPLLGSPAPYGADAPIQFGPPVLVDSHRRTAEPSIAVTPGGTIYIAAPTGAQESLWRSTDGGKTFTFIPIHNTPTDPGSVYPNGGGDSDVAVHGENTIYFADQQGGSGETVSVSHDGGATWTTTPFAAGGAALPNPPITPPIPNPVGNPVSLAYSADRQWLVTDGDLTAWMGFNSRQGATVVKTLDGGRTWPIRAFVEGDSCFRGNLARSPDGTLYLAGCNEDGPGVGISTDGGLSFTWHQVAQRGGDTDTGFRFSAHLFVIATTDAENNAYIVWSDEAQHPDDTGMPAGGPRGLNIWLATSTDHGQTWSKPKKVNTMPGTFVQPWATAGAPGHLAIVYYGTAYEGNPERALGEWYPIAALTQDALTDTPTWHEATISPDPVQYGPICMRGSACGGGRNLLDFFQVQADTNGKLHITYTDGRNGFTAFLSHIMYAGQTDGPDLAGPSVDKNAP